MNSFPVRLTIVLTHPVQYYSAWFRQIAADCAAIDLTVLYATEPTRAQQGAGFGAGFEWDVPLRAGYRSRVLRAPNERHSVRSDAFRGIDVAEIGEAILETKPDLVLVMGWHSMTYVRAIRACRRRGIPVLFRGDTNLGSGPRGWRRPLWFAKSWTLLRAFDGYLSVGRRSREYLRRMGVAPSRIFATPHTVDNEFFARSAARYQDAGSRAAARRDFGLAASDYVVLFAGKLEAKKRPLDLVRAMAGLGDDTHLLIAGSGPLEQACRDEAARTGVRAAFAGFLNQSEIPKAYASADCLALPSDSGETWGLVVNEAMATGLPCVVSDRVGCAPNLVTPGETGEVFACGDVGALRDALARMRRSTERGTDFRNACRARAARTSHREATEGLLAACQSVARRGRFRADGDRDPSRLRVIALCGQMGFVSGMERMTFEALRVVREQGGAVHTIVNTWANWDRPLEPHPIAALSERIGATWSTGYYWHRFDRHARSPVKLAKMAWDIACTSAGLLRDTARFRPTHVLVPEFLVALRNAPALLALKALGVPVIVRLGNVAGTGAFYRRIWRYAVNPVASHFICNSEYTLQTLLANGIPAGKTSVIVNTLPTRAEVSDAGRIERDPRTIIFVGQILPEKGVDLLVDALGILVARGIDARLQIVGRVDGWVNPVHRPFRAALEARVSAADVSGRISFPGWREDVPRLLSAAGVHCCPSREPEGFGLVVIEAKQAALPSVVTQSGALPSLVEHGATGWVCPDATPESLADGLAFFLQDPERQRRAGAAARVSLDAYSRDLFAGRWLRVFAGGTFHERREPSDRARHRRGRFSGSAPDAYAARVAAGARDRPR